MRLSSFLIENIEPILQEWENFARTLHTAAKPLNSEALRDHAELMLRAIATDLGTEQSAHQQFEKSQGHGPSAEGTAAESHAMARLMDGFSIDQVVSEFRALRASVVSHWMKHIKGGQQFEVEDMIRFNEAIDQALTESLASYTSAVQASRNIFLGILAHDLRTPLSAILLGADVLLRTDDLGARATKIASRIYASVKRAAHIVGDLLDFTRSQLGPGIPVKRAHIDMSPVCERIVDEVRTVYPEAIILLNPLEPVEGEFDGARLEQVFSNLIGNAVQHGSAHTPVMVTLDTSGQTLFFSVHNSGSTIPPDLLPFIFNPMGRYSPKASIGYGPYASLGLGLFIAAQIVAAHDGQIDVSSDEATGTTFVVKIPLHSPPGEAADSTANQPAAP
ncbi:sensor histidine kinase [Pseudomonas typographi]|uniref:sensor histidine kinase n=1 Tax=Pseudomonas typographi TaxID=2715964 RepID=UPI001688F44C|nr:sensor histidine kinase [Pseudomonas typographi]MBD1550533.1 sensor histidine kinase [Pseudomonas typographi]